MKSAASIFIFIALSLLIVGFIGKKVRISERYERAPRKLSAWSSLDRGIDPTEDKKP
jgi:hypothetical protein